MSKGKNSVKYLQHNQSYQIAIDTILMVMPSKSITASVYFTQVTDFGLSKFVDTNTMMKTFCGTPNYLAPEILETRGAGAYTKAIDCWSLGVILFIWYICFKI